MTVRLALFGSPTIEYGGECFALPFERRNQLLVFVALKRCWVGRAELAAMLWPEQENKLAYTNLRKTLFRLQSLPWAGQIELQGGAVRFEVDTDVFAFESALREHRIADALALRRVELAELRARPPATCLARRSPQPPGRGHRYGRGDRPVGAAPRRGPA